MKALIIIDVQNDFLPGGSLEVPLSDKIIPVINDITQSFDLVVATQDWHPADHKSFASNHYDTKPFDKIVLHGSVQILWPDHCVQGTDGAAISTGIDTKKIAAIFRKGMDREIDSYSAFFDNDHKSSTGLAGYLKEKDIKEVFFCGLAADICVYYSILDAVNEGFQVYLVEDASQPLDQSKFDDLKCDLAQAGVRIITSYDINR